MTSPHETCQTHFTERLHRVGKAMELLKGGL